MKFFYLELGSLESALCMCGSSFSQRSGQSLAFSPSGFLFTGKLPHCLAALWPHTPSSGSLGKADGKVSVRVWSSRATLWLWPAFKAKLKNWETQQVLDCSSKLRVLFIKLPAFVHSPEPSGCYFCLEFITVIGERVGGFRVHSFLLEEEPSSLILNTISNILAFNAIILLFALFSPPVLHFVFLFSWLLWVLVFYSISPV